MGLSDVLGKEDRVSVTFSDFYTLVKAASKSELMMNAINCDVPRRFIRETMTGKSEDTVIEEIQKEEKYPMPVNECSRKT